MTDANELVRDIYRTIAATYDGLASDLGAAALGYEILYGPPIIEPPVLFLGLQPGGDKPEPLSTSWPNRLEYGETPPPYRLAQRLQVAFDPTFLLNCTGLNAIFLRAPNWTAYQNISADLRRKIEDISLKTTGCIIEIIQPKSIVSLGFSTMRLFTSDVTLSLRSEKRVLLESGSISGVPAFAMPHPTGARPPLSNEELKKIGSFILDRL